ncbi:hypothetical protein V1506DRAFT_350175 [Lipomyces tetrasporus]
MSTTTNTPDSTPQAVLAISLALYPLLFYVITPRNATPSLVAKSHEAISAVHSTLVTLLSLFELRRNYDDWAPSRPFFSPAVHDDDTQRRRDERERSKNYHDALQPRELHYGNRDGILGSRCCDTDSGGAVTESTCWRKGQGPGEGDQLESSGGASYWAGDRVGNSAAIYCPGTPIGTTHWYLVNVQPLRRRAILLANFLYLTVYAVFRVYLVYRILDVFGSWTGHSAIEAFRRLPLPCRMGTGTIGAANSIWLIMGVRKFMRRYTSRARASK